jgi:hypothetical protein
MSIQVLIFTARAIDASIENYHAKSAKLGNNVATPARLVRASGKVTSSELGLDRESTVGIFSH